MEEPGGSPLESLGEPGAGGEGASTAGFQSAGDRVPSSEEDLHRVYQALLLYKSGLSEAEIAPRLPSCVRQGESVSVKSVAIILGSGMRTLLTAVLLEQRFPGLPEVLWPPEDVRQAVREARSGRTWRAQLRMLRAWLESTGQVGT